MSLAGRWLDGVYRERLTQAPWLLPLLPLSALYGAVARRRARAYRTGKKSVWRAPVPVIVVGNITLGGTGKSPLVAWLAAFLARHGYTPGIVTRGYGGRAPAYPLIVDETTPVEHSGDEPLMLFRQTGARVAVDPNRPRGARALIERGCDILISDDGLQHLALGRDIELLVIDGARGLGNRRCLPAGPLREPAGRLESVDAVIVNGALTRPLSVEPVTMTLAPARWQRVGSGEHAALTPLPFEPPVHAVAGIGNPARFFKTLDALGVEGERHAFADHHAFDAKALAFTPPRPLVMTAKDAVKCRTLAPNESWALEVEAELPESFGAWLIDALATRAPNESLSTNTYEEGAHG
ncbi:tetraacyldisaccharide 4'-kinase [Halomonas sp. HMF6819]|uniref:tetraacyldisaccharide 4'-kinase n=1 Tax=unclassified Halomonas TaxID=2609666 RepID=UPI002076AE3C|nr:tetraacyldisaccharide 4'-kinase [Halomonas sp. S3-1-8]